MPGQPIENADKMDTTLLTGKKQMPQTTFQTGRSLYSNVLRSNSSQDSTSKRKNVVRLRYLKENPPDRDYVGKKLLIESMNITALQVYALIHIHSNDSYDISFRTSLYLEKFWQKYQTLKDTKLWENFIAIKISQPNVRWATILFKNEMVPSTDVTFWLKRHCTPLTELQPLYDRNGFWTGGYRVQIQLQETPTGFKHLPCQLTIGQDRGYIFYLGQEWTCFKCGSVRHLSSDCAELVCSKCSGKGHLAHDCKAYVVCNLCNTPGHSYHNCPNSILHKDTR
uniref:CCHC-type domain-containing protein n=1 Tax=Latimeria chalumnae TaxID=7897 RepID=H3A265_LATCH